MIFTFDTDFQIHRFRERLRFMTVPFDHRDPYISLNRSICWLASGASGLP